MTYKIQTAGYATAFRVGEMILENGERLLITEFEYRPNPTSPDEEKMSGQMVFQPGIARRLIEQLQRKIDEIEGRKTTMN